MTQTSLIELIKGYFPVNQMADIVSCCQEENVLLIELLIQADLHWFKGHFPEQPVLAGVVQTHWATIIAERVFKISGQFHSIKNLKFKSVVLPGTELTLKLTFNDNKQSVQFRYFTEQEVYSQGQIEFMEA